MSETKHTPGPWDVGGRDFHEGSIFDSRGYHIADTFGDDWQSNSFLISAAPELLEAGEAVINAQGDMLKWTAAMVKLRAAIARARGVE